MLILILEIDKEKFRLKSVFKEKIAEIENIESIEMTKLTYNYLNNRNELNEFIEKYGEDKVKVSGDIFFGMIKVNQ